MKKIKVNLDGRFLAETEYNISDFQITRSFSANADIVGSDSDVSTKVTLRGRAFTEVYDKLIAPLDGENKALNIDFYDSCCGEGLIFSGEIRGDNVPYCFGPEEECKFDVQPIEKSDKSDLLNHIKSRAYAYTPAIKETIHPFVRYVIERRPKYIAHLLLILSLWAKIIFAPISWALKFASFGSLNDAVNSVNDSLNEFAVPSNRFHPVILIRTFIDAVLSERPGASFVSSILNNPANRFYFGSLIHGETTKGRTEPNQTGMIEGNEPTETLAALLDNLADLFNAKWWVQDSVLRFERKDFSPTGRIIRANQWTKLDPQVCFQTLDKSPPAYSVLKYSFDGIEQVGNEATQFYKTVREWNQPVNERQKGSREIVANFGMSRTFGDGINSNVFDTYGSLIISFLGTNYGDLENSLLLGGDNISPNAPKLVDFRDGRIHNLNAAFYTDAIFDEFHEIDNPRGSARKRFSFEFQTQFLDNCADMIFWANCQGSEIENLLPGRTGLINSVEADYVNRQVLLRGEI